MRTPTKGELTRERILAAARGLFITRGVEAVSIRDIAAAAGITHALVHRYFGTREQLLAAVVHHEIEIAGAALAERSAGIRDPFEVMRQTVAYAFNEGRGFVTLVHQIASDLPPEGLVPPSPVRPFADLAESLSSLQAERGASPGAADPAVTALVVSAATYALVNHPDWLMASVGLDPADAPARRDEMIAEIVRIAASAVAAAPPD